ncbi:MAG: hypothetical protein ABR899_06595 [Candidatus Krumholzibacteriaceae bacterium]|jgi:hypothetical protein
MNRRKLTIIVASLAVCAAIVVAIVSSRQWIAHEAYKRSSKKLEARLTQTQQKKYASDLRYTLDKFWQFYDKGLVSRNDLNDVMEKMGALRDKKTIEDMDLFDFIGYVSRLYTEAMRRRQSEMFPE